jgi:hypothetical protein
MVLTAGCTPFTRATEQKPPSQPVISPIPPTPEATATITLTPYPEITPLPIFSGSLLGKTIQSVCLEVKQGIDPRDGVPIPAGLRDEVAQLLRVNGMRATDNSAECDARLEITLFQEAIAGNYSGEYCYTGSHAQGKMVLTTSDGTSDEADIEGGFSPPFVVTSCPKDRTNAPLKLAVSKALFEGFSQIWGYEFLANVIRRADVPPIHRNMAADYCDDQSMHDRVLVVPCLIATAQEMVSRQGTALNDLAFLEHDALTAVPALIEMLETPLKPTPTVSAFYPHPGDVKEQAAEALKAITGQDFGTDAAQWQAWWDANGSSLFPTPVPCSQYARMLGNSVQVSGTVDYSDQMDFGLWVDFKGEECNFSGEIPTEALGNFDPQTLKLLQPGARVTLTGTVIDLQENYVILEITSIDKVE